MKVEKLGARNETTPIISAATATKYPTGRIRLERAKAFFMGVSMEVGDRAAPALN
jgi:hypothetical protein